MYNHAEASLGLIRRTVWTASKLCFSFGPSSAHLLSPFLVPAPRLAPHPSSAWTCPWSLKAATSGEGSMGTSLKHLSGGQGLQGRARAWKPACLLARASAAPERGSLFPSSYGGTQRGAAAARPSCASTGRGEPSALGLLPAALVPRRGRSAGLGEEQQLLLLALVPQHTLGLLLYLQDRELGATHQLPASLQSKTP